MKDGERIDPSVSLHDPGAEVFIARIAFFEKDSSSGGVIDAGYFDIGMLPIINPHAAIHTICLGVTDKSPTRSPFQEFRSKIARAMESVGSAHIFHQGRTVQSLFHSIHGDLFGDIAA